MRRTLCYRCCHEWEYLETLFMLCFVSILVSSAKWERSWIHLSQAKYQQIDIVAATHDLFSPWYCWQISELALSNNNSLVHSFCNDSLDCFLLTWSKASRGPTLCYPINYSIDIQRSRMILAPILKKWYKSEQINRGYLFGCLKYPKSR
jgi:hypothetical protein